MLNFNQLRNQINESNPPVDEKSEAQRKMKIGLTYKLEHAQNRMMIQTLFDEIGDLRGLDNTVPQVDD